ncbi:MAG: putative sulfate exporter family transporter [Pseudomonadota bacterium]
MKAYLLKFLFIGAGLFCLWPHVSAAIALFIGLVFTALLTNPFSEYSKKWASQLLAFSIICLGAGMNLSVVMSVGALGIFITAASIILSLAIAYALARIFKLTDKIASLIAVGTAICGGSAIAAVSPVLKPRENEIAVALAIVFILNAIALVLFPLIGQELDMSDKLFAFWSALAIHDTSSVVGATMSYSDEALEIGTTLKLVRALWIIPIVLALSFWLRRGQKNVGKQPLKFPWFILGFVGSVVIVNTLPALQPIGESIAEIGKRGLVLALFLIGASLSIEALKKVGLRPFAYGVSLWSLISFIASVAVKALIT